MFLAVAVVLFLVDLPGAELFEPDETRYAEISREMLEGGAAFAPTLNGAAYWEKPPLTYWLGAASRAAFGGGPWAARLPARLAALAVAAMLLAGAGGRDGGRVRAWSVVVWLTAPLPFVLGRANLTDGILAACTTGAFLAVRRMLSADGPPSRAAPWWLGACVGLGVLAKGLVAVVLPGGALLAWSILLRRGDALRRVLLSPAPVVAVAVAGPVFVLMEGAAPGFNRHFWIVEHFLRYATPGAKRPGPSWYYLAVVVFGMFPWSGHVLAAAGRPRWPRLQALRAAPDTVYLWLWLLVVVGFFSASASKLVPYVLPAIPAACILAARLLARDDGGPRLVALAIAAAWAALAVVSMAAARLEVISEYGLGGAVLGVGAVLGAGGVAMILLRDRVPALRPWILGCGALALAVTAAAVHPAIAARRTFADFAQRMAWEERESGARPATFRCHANGVPLAVGHPVLVVGHQSEMATDDLLPPEHYCTAREFWRRWDDGERMVVLVRDKDRDQFGPGSGHGPSICLMARDGFALLLRRPGLAR